MLAGVESQKEKEKRETSQMEGKKPRKVGIPVTVGKEAREE